ncbi:hypothetical protein AC249_AIPGENE7427 [Exaiptasia diaphana]|nr:hypothetical protein AC249_AIPGENE7427 [Exaiptasia diaphana]
MERLTIVRDPSSKGYVNKYEVLETGETFSSLTSDIASAFSEYIKYREFENDVLSWICTLTRENCEGCKIDHPSQRRHDCMMLDNKTMTSWYLTEALERVNEEEAMKTFLDYTNEHSPLNGLELLRYECKDSRSEIFSRRREELEMKIIELFESF